MSSSEQAFALIASQALKLDAKILKEESSSSGLFEMQVRLADGKRKNYQFHIKIENGKPNVKEVIPLHLPSSCPERHINFDGTFCLGWEGDTDLQITSKDSAVMWWSYLHKFLSLQARAEKKGEWPGKEWAHGAAAIFQQRAENAAAALGKRYVDALDNKIIRVVEKQKSGIKGNLLKLYLNDQHLCSVWKRNNFLTNKRKPCICSLPSKSKPKKIKHCFDHASQIIRLIISINEQEAYLKDFWSGFKGKKCCGSMKNCPLKITD